MPLILFLKSLVLQENLVVPGKHPLCRKHFTNPGLSFVNQGFPKEFVLVVQSLGGLHDTLMEFSSGISFETEHRNGIWIMQRGTLQLPVENNRKVQSHCRPAEVCLLDLVPVLFQYT